MQTWLIEGKHLQRMEEEWLFVVDPRAIRWFLPSSFSALSLTINFLISQPVSGKSVVGYAHTLFVSAMKKFISHRQALQ